MEAGNLTSSGGLLPEQLLPDVLVHLGILIFREPPTFRLLLLPRLPHQCQPVSDGFGNSFGVAFMEEARFHLVGGENGVFVGSRSW